MELGQCFGDPSRGNLCRKERAGRPEDQELVSRITRRVCVCLLANEAGASERTDEFWRKRDWAINVGC
jgi:hypothetical protein